MFFQMLACLRADESALKKHPRDKDVKPPLPAFGLRLRHALNSTNQSHVSTNNGPARQALGSDVRGPLDIASTVATCFPLFPPDQSVAGILERKGGGGVSGGWWCRDGEGW